MGVLKITFSTLLRTPHCRNAFVLPAISNRQLHIPCKTTPNKAATWTALKLPTTQKQITENLKLIQLQSDPASAKFDDVSGKPLVVILEWLLAKSKHIQKFSDIYLNHGFDVLTVKLKPRQLIWPVKGSQLVANDLLKTLHENHSSRPIVIHGFSVGGYLWGEVQVKMTQDEEKYKPLINNITGAIWDSVVDINETAVGVPAALFPKNAMLRNACQRYILYHMKVFENEATQHWRRSREMFYRPIVRCPALLLFSKTDPIGNTNSYKNVRVSYESMRIQIYEKCWDVSPHVAHYAFHKEEYVSQVELFLENIGLLVPVAKSRAAVI